jgi:hypothetical protein
MVDRVHHFLHADFDVFAASQQDRGMKIDQCVLVREKGVLSRGLRIA